MGVLGSVKVEPSTHPNTPMLYGGVCVVLVCMAFCENAWGFIWPYGTV